ncbi:MAG: flagellar motor protein MotB [Proteobacteria bacterium]|nr:flagellar motor protein MotB [Pseudomonadota bacterium]
MTSESEPTPTREPQSEGRGVAREVSAPEPSSTNKARRRTLEEFEKMAGRSLTDDLSGDDLWSIPWSDLMMVMFVLFAALLAVKSAEPNVEIRYRSHPVPEIHEVPNDREVEKEAPQPPPSFESLIQLNVFDRSKDAVLETQLQNIDIALLDDQSVKVSVQGPMFFERGRSELLPEMTQFLDRLGKVIRQTPYQIHVIGHTDDNPIRTQEFPSNWELSVVRASRVARHLIASAKIDPARFVVSGRGQYEPAYSNDNESQRAQNRRVEIIITREITDDGQGQQ